MSRVTSESVFLVSGGARGITAQCIIKIAEKYHCRFILLGRSAVQQELPWSVGISDVAALKQAAMFKITTNGEKPTPASVQKLVDLVLANREIHATVQSIEQAGGKALYISTDITNVSALVEKVTESSRAFGEVTGLIHGAGNLADKRIENKTERDFETVYAVKVQGLENLLKCVDFEKLQHVVLFSSVAGFYGNVGQADYAIANEILNKSAYRLKGQYPHINVISINWGPWDAGMVTPELKRFFDDSGIKVISVETGTQMLIDELEYPSKDLQVVIGSGINVTPKMEDLSLRTYRLQRKLRLEDSPLLADHVVNSKAVLPMVCAMSWMSNAGEQLYPGYKSYSFLNYKVLKGIIFDETLADFYTLELKEKEKSFERIVMDAMISSKTRDSKNRFHYSAELTLLGKLPTKPRYDTVDLEARDNLPGDILYENGTLFHRYSFKGVERILNISRDKVTMRCKLPLLDAQYQGQFPVQSFNYFMVDVGFQSMGIFARHFYGAGSLPLQAQAGEHYADVPFGETFYVSLEIRSSSETGLVTDLYIHDENGYIYMIVKGGEVTLSTRLNELFLLNTLPSSTH